MAAWIPAGTGCVFGGGEQQLPCMQQAPCLVELNGDCFMYCRQCVWWNEWRLLRMRQAACLAQVSNGCF